MGRATRQIKVETKPIESVDSFGTEIESTEKLDEAVKSNKPKKTNKSTPKVKTEVGIERCKTKKSTKSTKISDTDTVGKSEAGLVEKKTGTVGVKSGEVDGVKLEKAPKASKSKKAEEEPVKASVYEKVNNKIKNTAKEVETDTATKLIKRGTKRAKKAEISSDEITDISINTSEESPKQKVMFDNRGIDFLVSFDTTGSMYPVLSQVRHEVENLVTELFDSVKDIRIGVIVHGDYCDAGDPYTIRALDFTNNLDKIREFIRTSDKTYGGDADECYELVLKTAFESMSWDKKRNNLMMVIGDANPHDTNYPLNKEHIDWKYEATRIGNADIKIFAVHALSYYRESSRRFYQTLADLTKGMYLTLDQFSDVTNLIIATCLSQYSEQNLNDFVTIIRDNSSLTNGLARNINRLYGREVIEGIVDEIYDTPKRSIRRVTDRTDSTLVQKEGLVPIMPGRFQTMEVDRDIPIKQFVEENGIEFKKGRAFYELSKSEKVQQYKEVILQDRETGEMFNGSQVREYLGIKPQIASGGVTEHINSKHTKEFRVFVQSTSVNRKLIGGTKMLYEMSFEED